MPFSRTALTAALLAAGLLSGAARADGGPEFKFSGFGTLAAVHSSEKNADFVGNPFQPNGAGYTKDWSFGPDSKLAGQVNAIFNDKLSAVVQVVSQHNYDNSWSPKIEWINVKYQVTPELSLRAGRFALPTFSLSESRFVGYASPWVRPPADTYNVVPVTSSDGADATYRSRIGDLNNTLHAYYGVGTVRVPGSIKVKSNPAWGINDTVEFGSVSLRAGYNALTLDFTSDSMSQLLGGFQAQGSGLAGVPSPTFQAASARALATARDFKLDGMKVSSVVLGASYDPGDWFMMAEAADFKGKGVLGSRTGGYISAGYRFGALTPYVTVSKAKAHLSEDVYVTAVGDPATDATIAALNAGLRGLRESIAYSQRTGSVGVRWDAMKNVAVKVQYDHTKVAANSGGSLVNQQAGLVLGGSFNLFTVAVDFVF